MHRIRRISIIACFIVSLVCIVFGVVFIRSYAAPDIFENWSTAGWSVSEEDGTAVLRGNPAASLNVLSSVEKLSVDELAFDIYMDEVTAENDCNIGGAYRCTTGYQYFFEYNAAQKQAYIRRIGENGTDVRVTDATPLSLSEKKWYSVKLCFVPNDLKWYVNGKLILSSNNTYGDNFTMGSCYIQGYNVCPKLKNIKTSYNGGTSVNNAGYDFEFEESASVLPFTARKGAVDYREGCLVYTAAGEGSELISPLLNVACGDRYSARISIRNTIFMRMSNRTSANKIRVYFKTNEDLGFSEENSREFDVRANDEEFASCFFNLSGLTDSNGYITQFKLVPVGAAEGSIYIDCITFEREKAFYPYAGTITSCTADNHTVTINGTLVDEYAGKSVKIYEVFPENYNDSVSGLTPLVRVRSDGNRFTASIPFQNGNMTRLSALFLATVSGPGGDIKISERFCIENYRDFTENPYAFELPDLTVRVTESSFGAKGDAFTDDTASIQKAIDYVAAQGGGKVVIPGDDSYYGRRYVATNIVMKSNVELHIEKGAVIWQSPRVEDYAYDVAIGHDVYIPGVNWTTACSCHNLPLIQGKGVRNVKITGQGIIRSVDTGGDNLDTLSAISIWRGCAGRIHVIPIGFWDCTNVEISDITLCRTNNYHINMRTCSNIYIANVTLKEVTCAGGDGFSATVGTKNMILDRCFCFINDDAVTICSTYNDPRGQVSPWWSPNPGGDNCIDNLTVRHCNLYGGHGITFITWGTDAPDLSLQEIKNVEVYDCVLNGSAGSVGSWADNPYYGGVYDGSEVDDYSPVKQIYIHDNNYRGKATIDSIKATGIITDCGIRSAGDFQNGNFDRRNAGGGFVSGLSNWSYSGEKNTSFTVVRSDSGFAGKVKGTGKLWQGLYLRTGTNTMTADVKILSGMAELVAIDAVTGETIASQDVLDNGPQTFSFALTADRTVYLGIAVENGEAVIDNASVVREKPTYLQYFEENFEKLDKVTFDYGEWELTEEEGNGFISMLSGGGSKFTDFGYRYDKADVRFNVKIDNVVSSIDGNVSISFCRQDADTQYYLEYNCVGKYVRLRKFYKGTETVIATASKSLQSKVWYTFGLRFADGNFEFYIDGAEVLSGKDEEALSSGRLMIVTYNAAVSLDNVTVKEHNTINVSEKTNTVTEKEKYLVVFDSAGGNITPTRQVLEAGAALKEILTPSRDGFKFAGWSVDGITIDIAAFAMPDHDVRMVAVWQKNKSENGSGEVSGQKNGCSGYMSGETLLLAMFFIALAAILPLNHKEN